MAQTGGLYDHDVGQQKTPIVWESLSPFVQERYEQEGKSKEDWDALNPYEQEETIRQIEGEPPAPPPKKITNAWTKMPKKLRELYLKEDPSNSEDKFLSLEPPLQKTIRSQLQKKQQALENVPIPWVNFDYKDLWLLEYEANSEKTWNAIPAEMQRKIVKRLKKCLHPDQAASAGKGSSRKLPVKWEELGKELQEIYLKNNDTNSSSTWADMAPRDQKKEQDRLKRQLTKIEKKKEQEMRKKARLTPELLNAWLAEERTLIEWLNLPTHTKLSEMARLNTKLAKANPGLDDEDEDGNKRRRGRPFGATSNTKRAKTAAREALGGHAKDAFYNIAKFQEETKVAGVEKDNLMVLIQAYKGGDKKGRGRPRKDDLHNRMIFRVFGSSLNDMRNLLKQAYHQVKYEIDSLNNETEINPQVKLAKHELLFKKEDIDRSFAKTAKRGSPDKSASKETEAEATSSEPNTEAATAANQDQPETPQQGQF